MIDLITHCVSVPIEQIVSEESATRRKLIGVGEQLLGEAGLAGAALHRIAQAAGQGNKYAVQYHFGGLTGLCDAIFTLRQGELERRRERLVEMAREQGVDDTLDGLLQILYIPVAEQVDEAGRHSYARFVLQYLIRPNYSRHSDPRVAPHEGLTGAIYRRIGELLDLSFEVAVSRLYVANYMMYAALIDYDNFALARGEPPPIDETVRTSINLIAAALRGGRA